jgi:tetratricopeptide (TPR) repeat protein
VDLRRLVLALAGALVLAGVVVGLAVAQQSPPAREQAATCGKPLKGAPPLTYDLPGRYAGKQVPALRKLGNPAAQPELALALTEREYDTGQIEAARSDLTLASAKLGAQDTRITVGSAMLAWNETKPADVARTLEGLASDAPASDGLPLLQRGIVALWQGCGADASNWLEQTKSADPDSYYSTIADNLLHPEQNQNYPLFIANEQLPSGGVATRKAAAAAHPGDAPLQLAYALALQSVGQRTAARAAAERAVAADPRNLDAQVAAIVLGYDKDSPATSVGALGALIKQNPDQVALFAHMGELLLWVKRTALARQEFQKAVQAAPHSPDGRFAAAVLRQLS